MRRYAICCCEERRFKNRVLQTARLFIYVYKIGSNERYNFIRLPSDDVSYRVNRYEYNTIRYYTHMYVCMCVYIYLYELYNI